VPSSAVPNSVMLRRVRVMSCGPVGQVYL
jgi:hypothetical protein